MTKSNDKRQKLLDPFEVDCERGFLPSHDPLIAVPAKLGNWIEIADKLPKLLLSQHLRPMVDAVSIVSIEDLKNVSEMERAMLAFSFIAHAYVWGDTNPPKSLPASLAVPWYAVAKKLGRPPILSYASYMLHNWQRLEQNGPIALGNTCLIQNFLSGMDEEWFILVHLDIEAKAGPALAAILPAQEAAAQKNASTLQTELKTIEQSLDKMYASLLRMTERCDPYIYYHRVRPYIHGWRDHPQFPEGLIYEGVKDYQGKPQRFRGETGAQSSIIPSLDAALGIIHKDDFMRHYLNEMRDYMPPKHRAFIETIEKGPSIRQFVIEEMAHDSALREVYDKCVHWVEQFRSKHLEYATNYIFKQHESSQSNPHAVGTGGTPFIPYLEKHRDETAQHLLNKDHP